MHSIQGRAVHIMWKYRLEYTIKYSKECYTQNSIKNTFLQFEKDLLFGCRLVFCSHGCATTQCPQCVDGGHQQPRLSKMLWPCASCWSIVVTGWDSKAVQANDATTVSTDSPSIPLAPEALFFQAATVTSASWLHCRENYATNSSLAFQSCLQFVSAQFALSHRMLSWKGWQIRRSGHSLWEASKWSIFFLFFFIFAFTEAFVFMFFCFYSLVLYHFVQLASLSS